MTRNVMVLALIGLALLALLAKVHGVTSTDVIVLCILVPSIIIHEVAHGLMALACGDDTAKRAGRLSANPLRHVSLVGTIIVPIITIFAGGGFFGWAKPVPVNVRRLRHPRNQTVLVSVAGPTSNIVISAVFGAIFFVCFAHRVVFGASGPLIYGTTLLLRIVLYGGTVNLWVAVFNLIPIPPLDGSALVERVLPSAWWPTYLRYRQMGFVVLIGAVLILNWSHVDPLASVYGHFAGWWLDIFGR